MDRPSSSASEDLGAHQMGPAYLFSGVIRFCGVSRMIVAPMVGIPSQSSSTLFDIQIRGCHLQIIGR